MLIRLSTRTIARIVYPTTTSHSFVLGSTQRHYSNSSTSSASTASYYSWASTTTTTRNSTKYQIRTMASAASSNMIAVGTDLRTSDVVLQKARPWYMSSDTTGSNLAKDNVVPLKDLFAADKTIVWFGVPAPFTGTCSHEHYPGYKALTNEFLQSGQCDQIICYSVSDPYSCHGWELSLNNDPSKITFLADLDGDFVKAYGLDKVYAEVSLGLRSLRHSMIVENGIVKVFRLVKDASKDAQELLDELKQIKDGSSLKRKHEDAEA